MTDAIHPGLHIRQAVLPKGLTVSTAAKMLNVGRPALSNLLNGNSALSSEMALRIEKAFGANSEDLLKLQAEYDRSLAQTKAPAIAVRAYAPSFLNITAMQIEAWSDHLDARAQLPALLRKLATTTGAKITKSNFPAFDNSQRPGWDGEVEATDANPWVPLGRSGWEFGCNKDAADKAREDYAARTKSIPLKTRKAMTFVFVTPRNWGGKDEWASARRALSEWKDVRAYDASDLEQWVEQSVPAQTWLGEFLPLGLSQIQSIETAWKKWAEVTDPILDEKLFADAVADGDTLLAKWLSQEPERPFTVVGDSIEEAVAYLCCAFKFGKVSELNLADKAVVLKSADALERATKASSGFIAIVASVDAELESAGIHRRQHTVVVTRRNAIEGDPDIRLDLLSDETFRAGLEAMGLADDRVERLKHESGHSITVLRRRLSSIPAIKTPIWAADAPTAKALIPLVLVGAWDSRASADQAILEELAAGTHDDIEGSVAELLLKEQAPVWSAGSFRGVVSKLDALYAIHHFITRAELERFFEVSRLVLAEADPALDLPLDDRWMAGIHGKTRKHSGVLRQGLCETLVLLAVHGNSLFRERTGLDIEAKVAWIIRDLLTPIDALTWQSQQDDLPSYAEAAPNTFLDVLETDLSSEDPKILALMQSAGTGVFSSCPRTGLLWALENLAWSPQLLTRVIAVTSKLAKIKVEDNWVNRPDNTLASIFRCWMPQTAATIEQRIAALDFLVKRNPEIGWKICHAQFDDGSRIGHYNHRPRWRNDAAGAGRPVNGSEIYAMARHALDLALGWPAHNERTLGDLIDGLGAMTAKDRQKVWALVKQWAKSTADDDAKATLRERIRRSTMTRRGMRNGSETAMRADAKAAFELLCPADLVVQNQWLFATQWVEESADELDDDDLDWRERDERIANLRRDVLRQIWAQSGIEGVARLLLSGDAAGTIGWLLADVLDDLSDREKFLEAMISKVGDPQEVKFNGCVAGFLGRLEAADRRALLLKFVDKFQNNADIQSAKYSRILEYAPFTAETWELIDSLPEEVRKSYWRDVVPRWGRQEPEEINRIVDEFLEIDRPRAAFRAVHMDFEHVTTANLKRLIFEAGTNPAEPNDHYRLSSHEISDALDELGKRPDATVDDLARLEFLFLSALDHARHGIPNLERRLSESPQLFLEALVMAFKRSDGGEDPPQWQKKNSDQAQALATAAYSLLTHAKRTPGMQDDGSVDQAKLREWLLDVRASAKEVSREAVADSLIGQLLAKSPKGADDVWPCEAVREVLEDIGTAEIAEGLRVGVFNKRGAVWRGVGGGQERTLEAQYRDWAMAVSGDYLFMGKVLHRIADMYAADAGREDTEARIRRRLHP